MGPSWINTLEVIMSDWHNTVTGTTEELKKPWTALDTWAFDNANNIPRNTFAEQRGFAEKAVKQF